MHPEATGRLSNKGALRAKAGQWRRVVNPPRPASQLGSKRSFTLSRISCCFYLAFCRLSIFARRHPSFLLLFHLPTPSALRQTTEPCSLISMFDAVDKVLQSSTTSAPLSRSWKAVRCFMHEYLRQSTVIVSRCTAASASPHTWLSLLFC